MPDLSWETAELIVHNSIEEGVSLIRVFNSKVLPLRTCSAQPLKARLYLCYYMCPYLL